MFVYTAEAGSKSEESLDLLASWAATGEQEAAAADRESRRALPVDDEA